MTLSIAYVIILSGWITNIGRQPELLPELAVVKALTRLKFTLKIIWRYFRKMAIFEQWKGFKGKIWQEEINTRDFIQNNYTPYDGDASFLAGPAASTNTL